MFALVIDGTVYLKAGENNLAMFEREGLAPFTYATSKGTRGVTSYRRMPDRLYDDPDTLAEWARAALAAARESKSHRESSTIPRKAPKPKKTRAW